MTKRNEDTEDTKSNVLVKSKFTGTGGMKRTVQVNVKTNSDVLGLAKIAARETLTKKKP
jgi:hypothetical protein